jgi:hypothetical protein
MSKEDEKAKEWVYHPPPRVQDRRKDTQRLYKPAKVLPILDTYYQEIP